MPKWLKACLVGVALSALLLAGFVVVRVATCKGSWKAEASTEIDAPPERVWPLILELERWPEWSTWTRDVDSGVRRSYSSDEKGIAWLHWESPRLASDNGVGFRVASGREASADAGRGDFGIRRLSVSSAATHTWYWDRLNVASTRLEAGGVVASSCVVSGSARCYYSSGTLSVEADGANSRVTWTETGGLGDGFASKLVAPFALPVIERVETNILSASLARLRACAENAN